MVEEQMRDYSQFTIIDREQAGRRIQVANFIDVPPGLWLVSVSIEPVTPNINAAIECDVDFIGGGIRGNFTVRRSTTRGGISAPFGGAESAVRSASIVLPVSNGITVIARPYSLIEDPDLVPMKVSVTAVPVETNQLPTPATVIFPDPNVGGVLAPGAGALINVPPGCQEFMITRDPCQTSSVGVDDSLGMSYFFGPGENGSWFPLGRNTRIFVTNLGGVDITGLVFFR